MIKTRGKNISANLLMKYSSKSYSSLPSMTCKICDKIAFSPVVCPECKKVICSTCSYKTGGNGCSFCNNNIGIGNETGKLLERNRIGIKKKYCKYVREGCQFTILFYSKNELGKLNILLEHENVCRYKPINCPNQGCKNPNILAKDFFSHSIDCNASKKECYGCKKEFTTEAYKRDRKSVV